MGIGKLSGLLVEELLVAAPLVGDLQLQWVVSVGRLQERDQGLDQELGVLRGDPVVLDGLRADLPRVLLDVRVVDLCQELDFGALERVLVSEVHVYVEMATVVGGVLLTNKMKTYRSDHGDVPVVGRVVDEDGTDAVESSSVQLSQLL